MCIIQIFYPNLYLFIQLIVFLVLGEFSSLLQSQCQLFLKICFLVSHLSPMWAEAWCLGSSMVAPPTMLPAVLRTFLGMFHWCFLHLRKEGAPKKSTEFPSSCAFTGIGSPTIYFYFPLLHHQWKFLIRFLCVSAENAVSALPELP